MSYLGTFFSGDGHPSFLGTVKQLKEKQEISCLKLEENKGPFGS